MVVFVWWGSWCCVVGIVGCGVVVRYGGGGDSGSDTSAGTTRG